MNNDKEQKQKEQVEKIVRDILLSMPLRIYQDMIVPGQVKQRHIMEGWIIFHGLAADRPTNSANTINPVNAYFAEDTGVFSLWTGTAWLSETFT